MLSFRGAADDLGDCAPWTPAGLANRRVACAAATEQAMTTIKAGLSMWAIIPPFLITVDMIDTGGACNVSDLAPVRLA
jgi:hypothetical protein